ncbi:hypothetical protein QFC20_003406 [Naganishia adeliensis]|uniref:Uncharacterized protein n=1 Tax=Naganishia adeliensis TaxID=92952 RepID=A0ACC2WAZ4_9TREE|nr:hypothetical protein QFC20_003406 [Naganishia adeliensis]
MQATTKLSLATKAATRNLQATPIRAFQYFAPLRNSESRNPDSSSNKEEIEAVKARAWYIDADDVQEPPPPSVTGPRQPRFTTFDPLRTLPTPREQVVIPPLPKDTPASLLPLHDFLTSNDLFVPETATFRRTAKSAASQTYHDPSIFSGAPAGSWAAKLSRNPGGQGKRRRGQTDSGEGILVEGRDAGANWDWIVVCQVAARGKGAVGRAEKNLREWLFRNPHNRPPPPSDARMPKFKASGDPESEWALIDVGDGVCINLMTAEGRQKWDLEGAWKPLK